MLDSNLNRDRIWTEKCQIYEHKAMPNLGYRFSEYIPRDGEGSAFDKLLKIFQELLIHTSGDLAEALSWLTQLDKEFKITDDEYGIADFLQDLIDKGYIRPNGDGSGFRPAAKMEIALRQKALEDIFGVLKKSKPGGHNSAVGGRGDEFTSDVRPYEFGDPLENLAISDSMRNAQINHGI